jgi:hypothetical protein
MPQPLKSNVQDFYVRLNMEDLPAVFQDAVYLTRAPKIPYTWIDALCIMQDNPDEVKTEVSNMGIVYQHAILNLGSLEAAEPSTNLFDRAFCGPKSTQILLFHVDNQKRRAGC